MHAQVITRLSFIFLICLHAAAACSYYESFYDASRAENQYIILRGTLSYMHLSNILLFQMDGRPEETLQILFHIPNSNGVTTVFTSNWVSAIGNQRTLGFIMRSRGFSRNYWSNLWQLLFVGT